LREPASVQGGRTVRARIARRVFFCLALGWIIASGICFFSYYRDRLIIHAASSLAIRDVDLPAQKVLRLNEWAHGLGSTARNQDYFLFPGLRATPPQVLHGGGDCAYKSRLLWAALCAQGIPATMVMLFDPAGKAPTHTVVEARLGEDRFMVADPAFNLVFPRPDGGYFSLLDLRRKPAILDQRLEELVSRVGAARELRGYRRDVCTYHHASSVNWNHGLLTKTAFAILHPMLGEDVYRFSRPVVLEEPELAVAALALGVAIICGAAPSLLARVETLTTRRIMPSATDCSAERHVVATPPRHSEMASSRLTNTHVAS
jgi:hypothetical protein